MLTVTYVRLPNNSSTRQSSEDRYAAFCLVSVTDLHQAIDVRRHINLDTEPLRLYTGPL